MEGRQQHDSEGLLQLLTQGGLHQLLSGRGSHNATVIAQVRVQKGGGGTRGTWKVPNKPGRTGKKLKLAKGLPHRLNYQL